jgi:hypothetical protein
MGQPPKKEKEKKRTHTEPQKPHLVKLGEEEEISSPSGRSWNHDTCCSPPWTHPKQNTD